MINTYIKNNGVLLFFVLPLFLLGIAFKSSLKQKFFDERTAYDLAVNTIRYQQETIRDLKVLQSALSKYHADYNSYPRSSGGWDAVEAAFGESKQEWIGGLVPRYLKSLPTDPRKYKTRMEQYMYKSDGKDYKLLAHFPAGMPETITNHLEMADPIRPSWAIGVWTENARTW